MSRQIAMDAVGRRMEQWGRELPDVDTSGMAILGRARWIVQSSRPTIEGIFAAHQLETGEFDVLATLRRNGAPYRLRPTELFKSLMISSGGLTDRVDRLVRSKLVKRVKDPADGRSFLVELTPKGIELAEAVFREDMSAEAKLLAPLSAAERQQLSGLLIKLALAFEAREGN